MRHRSSLIALVSALGLAAVPAATAASPATTAPRCTTAQLRISLAPVSGGLEHAGVAVEFRDRGTRCSLEGYPGVAGLSPSGATVFNAHRSLSGYLGGARRIAPVTLTNGASASALLEWLDIPSPGQTCPRAGTLAVTPPGNRESVRLQAPGRRCGPIIHPVVAGSHAGSGV